MKYLVSCLGIILGLLLFSPKANAQCGCTNCPLDLPDVLTEAFTGNIFVDNTTNDVLGSGGQCLESVCFDITHDWIGDLDITLIAPDGTSVILYADGNSDSSLGGNETSPFGESLDNMNVCFVLPGQADIGATGDPLIFGTIDNGNCNTDNFSDPCNGTDPCFTGNWEPWDAGCNGTNGIDAFNNGTGTVSGTWQVVINDNAGANEGVLNDVTLNFCTPPDGDCTTSVDCGAMVGTITNSAGTNEVFLCDNESVTLTSNNDFVLPDPAGLDPVGMGYAIYNCSPDTNIDPNLDPCFTGYYFTGQDITEINAIGNTYEFITANPLGGFAVPSGDDLYFVPTTMDDICDDPLLLCDANLGTNIAGDGCFELGTPVHITYLPQVTVTSLTDCDLGTVTYTFSGGQPSVDASSFTINSTGAGTPNVTTVPDGGSVTFSNLVDGNTIDFTFSDTFCTYGPETISYNCSDVCLVNYDLTATPPPSDFPNNEYPPNTTVTFCFDILQYIQTADNFLHGIVPSVSGAWDPNSVNPTLDPVPAANNEVGSNWQWLPGGTITSNQTGTAIVDDGWWFFSVNPIGLPTDANNSWGDGCTASCYPDITEAACNANLFGTWVPNCGCTGDVSIGELWVGTGFAVDITDPAMTQTYCESLDGTWDTDGYCVFWGCESNIPTANSLQWNTCFEVTTIDCVSPYNGDYSLGVSIETYADGETGNWTDIGCLDDLSATYDADMCCIEPPAPLNNTFCEGEDMTITGVPTNPAYTLNWYTAATGGLPANSGTTFDPGALSAGSYTYYYEQNDSGCSSVRETVDITVNPLPAIVIDDVSEVEVCNDGAVSVIISTTITDADSFSWSPGGLTTDDITVSPTSNTSYILTAVNSSCGTIKDTVDIFVFDVPDLSVILPDPICTGDNFDLSTLTIVDNTNWPGANGIDTTLTYHSADPPTALNELSSLLVTPAATTTYYIQSSAYICSDVIAVEVQVQGCCDGATEFIDND